MFSMAFPMLALAYDTNGLFIGEAVETGDLKACVAGSPCGGTLLGTITGNAGSKNPPYAHGVKGYFGLYGTGQFDGQGSGHDFWGTVNNFVCRCLSDRSIPPLVVGYAHFLFSHREIPVLRQK